MPFFGPPPPPPAERYERPQWGPPLWDRPAEDTLGISVGVSELLVVDDARALAFEDVKAFPNGFV